MMSKEEIKDAFLEQIKDIDRQIENLEELREGLYSRIDQLIEEGVTI